MTDSLLLVGRTTCVGGEIDFGSDTLDLSEVRHWILSELSDQKDTDIHFTVSTFSFYCAALSIIDDIINLDSSRVYEIGDDKSIKLTIVDNITFRISFLFGTSTIIVSYDESLTIILYRLVTLLKELHASAHKIGMNLDKMMSLSADVYRQLRL